MTISLCMIIKNEEALLGRFLSDSKRFFDEIIVVDTGSIDNSRTIAEKQGTRVFSFKWGDDFSAARNYSIREAKSDWIVWLDPDEVINEEDLKKLKELMINAESDIYGISLIQKNYTNFVDHPRFTRQGKSGFIGYFSRRICKVFRNNLGISFEYPVHETVKNSIERKGGKILHSDIIVEHFPENKGKDFLIKKEELYLRLLAKKQAINKKIADKEIEFENKIFSYVKGRQKEPAI